MRRFRRGGGRSLSSGAAEPDRDLVLAGDWTRTGWPSTMEGAVRSGYLAAETMLAGWRNAENFLQPDLGFEGLCKCGRPSEGPDVVRRARPERALRLGDPVSAMLATSVGLRKWVLLFGQERYSIEKTVAWAGAPYP